MTSSDLDWLDATALAALVRDRQVSALELVDAAIARIERLNPRLNAVVTPMFEQAREQARGELPNGPFRGVPFLVKDLLAHCAGVRHTGGSRLLAEWVPDFDAELVVRHRRAGLVILGRTNTPEIGILPTTEPELFGACHNPWDPTRSTGGSSGGSAAAVAAGLVSMAHANDGGGSIRIPAACCGVFGLKPTRARNPMGPELGDSRNGLAQEHAVTRSVRDSARLLDATAGPDVGDPYYAPPVVRPFADEVGAPPGRLRIGLSTRAASGAPVHQDCIDAVLDAARLCEELGHHVEESAPDTGDPLRLTSAFVVVWSAGVAATVWGAAERLGRVPNPSDVEPCTWALSEMGRGHGAHEYLGAVTYLQRVARRVARWFVDHDVLLTPVCGEPPPLLGTFASPPETPLLGFFRAGMFASFTGVQNVTGQPAMSVPLYWNAAGLPIGTHFVARFGDEATLFRLAAQLEAARPWAWRRPP
jgi:amidase